MGRMNVGIAVHLRDEFSNKAQNIHNKMQLLYGDADDVINRNQRALGAFASTAMGVGAGLSIFSYGAVKQLANYEKSVSMLKASIGTDMDMAFQGLEDRIKQTAIASRYSIEETTSAATELARAGYKASDIFKMIGAATDLGQAGDIPIEASADALGRVLSTYDMAASSSNFVADKIAITANKSNASVSSLMESLKYSGDILRSTNVPFEVALSLFGRLGNAGLRGSIAGTSVANMLRYLNKAATDLTTGKQSKALAMLGMGKEDLLDESGNLKQLIGENGEPGLLDTLGKKLRSVDPSKAQAIAEALTGVRGERSLIPLMEITENTRSFEELYKMIKAAPPGTAKKFSEELMDNLWGDLEKLRENFTAMLLVFAENKGLRGFVQLVTKGIEKLTSFMSSPLGSVFSSILFYGGPLLVLIGSLTWGMQKFARFTMLAKEGMFGLAQTARHQGLRGLSGFYGGINSPAQSLYAQNIRLNSAGVPYMGAGGGTYGGRSYVGGSMLTAAHRASMAPYLAGLHNIQTTSAAAGTSLTGVAGTMGRMATVASRAMGLMGIGMAALGPIMDLLSGKMGGAMGGLLGGVLGFMAGGPMGAIMGSMMGGTLGGAFDSEAGESYDLTSSQPSQASFTMGADGSLYRAQNSQQPMQQQAQFTNNINVNIDGYNSITKRYENENSENIYSVMGN